MGRQAPGLDAVDELEREISCLLRVVSRYFINAKVRLGPGGQGRQDTGIKVVDIFVEGCKDCTAA